MLPVCSAAPSCSLLSSVSNHVGVRFFYPLRKSIDDRSIIEDRHFFCMQHGLFSHDISFRANAANSVPSLIAERTNKSGSVDSSIFSPYPNESDDIVRGFPNGYFDSETEDSFYSAREIDEYIESPNQPEPEVLHSAYGNDMTDEISGTNVTAEPLAQILDQQSTNPPSGDDITNIPNSLDQSANAIFESTSAGSPLASDASQSSISESSVPVSATLEGANKEVLNFKDNIEHSISQVIESIHTSTDRAEETLKSTYDELTLSVTDAVKNVTKSFDSAVSGLFSSVDISKKEAVGELSDFSSSLQEKLHGAGYVSINILRRTIFAVEDSLANTAKVVINSYGAAKSLLPPNVKDVLNLSEEKATQILSPVGSAFQKVYVIIEGFEKNLGLDPNDPIIPFILFLGSSATIGISYWVFTYGGYSGDLSPELTLELLKNDENAVLIDVRPEDLRERDGVPDLRRAARSKYASVTLPELDGSVKGKLKGGRHIDDALIAVVIRNLKIVKNKSKVIIIDASGAQSKEIARFLKRLGVKRSYLVKGGFQSWVNKNLRVKELKLETALTVLNEEAEAILEDIKPTPALVAGYALGIATAIYALLEWEKTLQVIGIVGLGQTLYRRLATYEDAEDLKQDVRLLLAPVRLGAQAFSWAAGKLEPNKIGLPTSPSTTAVRDRVVQAAAKHESQPSDAEENQELPGEPSGQANITEA
ncbi:uncharacterized protein [Typha angustifolia]|uniref:uncharacterized protein isoform X1 n=2 Tax=Typha angustifolia TaxID=59011 RepID=UPI003C2E5CA1